MYITPLKPSLIDREILRSQKIHDKQLSKNFDKQNASVESVLEAWSEYPHRFFFFNCNSQIYCGQKLISESMLDLGCQVLFCSYMKAEMILGKLLRVQTSEVGIEIYYEDIAPQSRLTLFEQLMNDKMIDLYFPYVPLKKDVHKEYTSPPAGWKINPQLSSFLLNGEQSQRKISIDLIRSDGRISPIIYDPACSTGDFLYSIKAAIPDAIVIGQDLSQDMCIQARQKIDRVTHGDALFPCVPIESCDYIFFRFLNINVISCFQAKALFEAIIPCLKKEGKAILFGFTPVLISLPYLMKKGFRVLSCNAPVKSENAIIQYYIIQKI